LFMSLRDTINHEKNADKIHSPRSSLSPLRRMEKESNEKKGKFKGFFQRILRDLCALGG